MTSGSLFSKNIYPAKEGKVGTGHKSTADEHDIAADYTVSGKLGETASQHIKDDGLPSTRRMQSEKNFVILRRNRSREGSAFEKGQPPLVNEENFIYTPNSRK